MFNTPYIHVFSTNLATPEMADQVCSLLVGQGIAYKATVDLEDCDRILRVESTEAHTMAIYHAVTALGIEINELD